jgi:hypothetical protein
MRLKGKEKKELDLMAFNQSDALGVKETRPLI